MKLCFALCSRRSDLSSILVEFWGTHHEHDGPVHKEYMIHWIWERRLLQNQIMRYSTCPLQVCNSVLVMMTVCKKWSKVWINPKLNHFHLSCCKLHLRRKINLIVSSNLHYQAASVSLYPCQPDIEISVSELITAWTSPLIELSSFVLLFFRLFAYFFAFSHDKTCKSLWSPP